MKTFRCTEAGQKCEKCVRHPPPYFNLPHGILPRGGGGERGDTTSTMKI